MITKTSLRHPKLMENLKATILEAVQKASVDRLGVYPIPFYNSQSNLMMTVTGVKGRSFRVSDSFGNDITALVKESFKEYHNERS